jgi:CRP/FNR family transcriptional regulator, cyclic AMP receptor protein
MKPSTEPVRLAASDNATRVGRARVLDEDPELGEELADARLARARQASVANVIRVRTGSWEASEGADRAGGGFGLLLLDGVLVRRVGVEGRYGAELLAKGDLLRPWEHDGEGGVLPFETAWQVVETTRAAILDLRWAAQMAPFPEVAGQLMARLMQRSRRLAMLMAIAQQPRLEQRLWLVFWELADRYGTVHPDGVHIDLPLTHEVLSHLTAAQRPSVSSALGRLADGGIIRRVDRSWVIHGDPPQAPLGDERGLERATP